MKNVLVTGGAGFIGSNLVRMLTEEYACNVTVLDNMLTGRRENIRCWDTGSKVEIVDGSVLDVDLLQNAFPLKPYILHLLRLSSAPDKYY